MAGGARRPRLTKTVHQQIVQLLEGGNFFETAVSAAGISPATARTWLRLGMEPGSRYQKFRTDCLAAMARSEATGVEMLAKAAAAGDVRAVQWWLERRHPGRWGLRVRHVLAQEMESAIDRVEAALSGVVGEDVVERVLVALAGELGGEEAAPAKGPEVH